MKAGIGMVCAAMLLAGCASVCQLSNVAKLPSSSHGKLTGLALSTDQNQMTGVSRGSIKLAVGASAVLHVRGTDEKTKWFELPSSVVVNWKCDKEVEVTPKSGSLVTVKAVSPIAAAAYVTATTVNEAGQKIESVIQINN